MKIIPKIVNEKLIKQKVQRKKLTQVILHL